MKTTYSLELTRVELEALEKYMGRIRVSDLHDWDCKAAHTAYSKTRDLVRELNDKGGDA